MTTTNDDLLAKEGEILHAVNLVGAAIPGSGSSRLATEEFIRQQISGLKKEAGGKKEEAPKEEKKNDPSVIDQLGELANLKGVVDSIKGFVSGGISLTAVLTLSSALVAAIGLKLFSFDALFKDLLAVKDLKMGDPKWGLPTVKRVPQTIGPALPTVEDMPVMLMRVQGAVGKVDTAVTGLTTKVDHLLAELS
ncbi:MULTISPECIES: hypothetical protein [unclassified Streptomyces]|uniref:hypothetical protein n=1 Tax=unclassified Streptomyces TaxID=2593676 RepID=UPI00081E0C4D|nr:MULTISPECIES: hypothetical protein [unclassified Streptomyces]MYR25123.1 hypothetical protein [Streptomyces sp. SID4945]SCE74515.1 hypothetical protein GA0115257_101710 [Streptomyces sp. LcepLS]